MTKDIQTLILFLCRGRKKVQEALEKAYYPYHSPEEGTDILNMDYRYVFDPATLTFDIIWYKGERRLLPGGMESNHHNYI